MKLQELCPVPLPSGLNLTQEVWIGPGVIRHLPEAIERYLREKTLRIADPDTWEAFMRDGQAPAEPAPHLLPRHTHGDEAAINGALSLADGKSGLIAIGSGVINDLVKYISYQRKIPYIVAGTAASMNGYASAIAAIMMKGVKVTLPAAPPRAIILDTNILRAAPPALAQAGLGDLLSKPLCAADWWMGVQLEGGRFDDLPGKIVDRAIRQAVARASALARGEEAAFQALGEALTLSGVSMAVAGDSRPASGGEHLISHFWDMEALAQDKPMRLHGAQVGVSSCLCAAVYQRILALEKPIFADPAPWDVEEQRIRRDHGILAGAVLDHAKRKRDKADARLAILREQWPRLREGLTMLQIPRLIDLQTPLIAAGAPHTLRDLGVSKEEAARSVRLARDIRDRHTVLDLAFELGLFPDAIEEIVEEVDAA
ncbi:MAG: sn-glycerol-1-phosphate dehydrogenase [Candidatus Omnitrophota bacterium]